jgi:serine protease AprX
MHIDKSGSLSPSDKPYIGTERIERSPLGDGLPEIPGDSYAAGADELYATSGWTSVRKTFNSIIVPPDVKQGGMEKQQAELNKMNVFVQETLPVVGGFVATIDEARKQELEKKGYTVIRDDALSFLPPNPSERVKASGEGGVENVEASSAIESRTPLTEPRYSSPLTEQYTGKDVTIAVLDTGIYPHPDLTFPNNRIIAFKDFVNGRNIPYDDNGHGTHVAGDAAGNGAVSQGLYRGPAPEANIVGIKVLDRDGNGRTSTILKGIIWAIENRERYGIKVLNISLGNTPVSKGKADPVAQAVEKAVASGIVVVVAAGNEGPGAGTISSPGDNPKVITVGAVDDNNTPSDIRDDKIPEYSSRGPTTSGTRKPDLLAPGEGIVGPSAPATPMEEKAKKYSLVNETLSWLRKMSDGQLTHVPEETLRLIGLSDETINQFKTSPALARAEINRLIKATDRLSMIDSSYIISPGTSMAAPIVAGVVAELLHANPNLTPDQVKSILLNTAHPLPEVGRQIQGAGELNPHEALKEALEIAKEGKPVQGRFQI